MAMALWASSYSQNEMSERMAKAERYIRYGFMADCTYFMRDKSDDYFNDIEQSRNGIMEPYTKDDHGDPRSPINSNLKGLFFSVSVDQMALESSIYGSKRFKIEASALVDGQTRAYFADFYCVPGKSVPRPHYITIVLTRNGSAADHFCRRRLVQLDLARNPFIRIQESGDSYITRIVRKDHLHVELFYTEQINIRSMIETGRATLSGVSQRRVGANLRNPRSKSASCEYCG